MNTKHLLVVGLAAVLCTVSGGVARANANAQDHAGTGLVSAVREATGEFGDVNVALAAGYGSTESCVSGPQEGAMGVHFANFALIGDGILDAGHPELLLYEQRGGRLQLLGVEFLVIAEAWHAVNALPPVLMGQHFHYVGSPNRYGLPPFYELHVWAWRENPHGMFVDWNPQVTCEQYPHGSH
jgi:hypothetical protein